jgi:hypothetical protein
MKNIVKYFNLVYPDIHVFCINNENKLDTYIIHMSSNKFNLKPMVRLLSFIYDHTLFNDYSEGDQIIYKIFAWYVTD